MDDRVVHVVPRIGDGRGIYILQPMLKDVIKQGTGRRAKSLGRSDIAGKTGTTNEQKDAWFSGFNRDVVAATWVGFDQPRTIGEYGSKAALPIWVDFMDEFLKGKPESSMPQPPGLVTVRIDPETGKRASPGQSDALFEVFRVENVPQEGVLAPAASSSDQSESDSGLPVSPADETAAPETLF